MSAATRRETSASSGAVSAATRAAAREAALQMLYALEVGGQDAVQIERWYVAAHPLAPAVRERAGALVDAAVQHRARIEELIGTHAHGWKLERISLIDRGLLKLACAELLLEPEPAWPEAIQAAERLAKRFSQPEAQRFVRGLLEGIATALRTGAGGASSESPTR